MKDINFDELDKAVSSVLQQSAKPDESKEPEVVAEPEVVKPAKKEEPQSSTTSTQVVTKRRGQFMDMVHPSSDMTTSNTAEAKKTPMPSRQSATIKPLNPEVVETTVKSEKNAPEVKQTASIDLPKDEDDKQPSIIESELLDDEINGNSVLDNAVDKKNEEKATDNNSLIEAEGDFGIDDESADRDDDVSKEERDDEKVETEDEDSKTTTQETPFIPGQDVEKRPLGAFTEAKAQEDDSSNIAPEEPEVIAPVQMPQELTPEIVSVESDDPTRMSGELMDIDAEDSVSSLSMTSSIPQQYSTMPDSDDQDGHPVFDTKEYHQPLTPPAKHSHVGLIVFLIVLVVALGVGAWYAIAVLKLF